MDPLNIHELRELASNVGDIFHGILDRLNGSAIVGTGGVEIFTLRIGMPRPDPQSASAGPARTDPQ